ncbi:MAG: pyridoxal phosphate-dependent aminotransferase [Gordonia sp. (in: high G+C Gram-positive bacteria)]|uniref:pyridoxal phosphate-dependent aminotransferase n=1 Tax=Gordonia sp. (in: high G+C Gram-positive bacteria) TaxID=84139 RepID=UPI003BB626EF
MALVQRLQPFATTIFAEMSALALAHDAVNLGQGFPDTDGPAAMLAAAQRAIADGHNQYPPGIGIGELREAISAQQARDYHLHYDPDTQVLVTVGATEAIAGAVLGLVEPGREVILIEPYYDSYAATVALAGARRRTVPLVTDGNGFRLDLDALRAAFGPDTAAIIVNTPHNPTGTQLTDGELAEIARLCVEHDVIAIADEVYERLLFGGRIHRPLASFDGMRQRTLRISSAAKTFNVTGWKVGWVSGPADLVAAARGAKQYLSYVGSGPFQPAVALALRSEADWVAENARSLEAKAARLSSALSDVGFGVHHTDGTYFVVADPRPLGYHDGAAFCRELPARIGVAAVPVSAFVDPPSTGLRDRPDRLRDRPDWSPLVRFAFSKRDDVLAEATRRLRTLGDRS